MNYEYISTEQLPHVYMYIIINILISVLNVSYFINGFAVNAAND